MKNIKITILFICLVTKIAFAQVQSETIKPLNVGDKIYDISLGKIINSKDTTINFSDLRGKLIILDFWEPWCGDCVAALPKMESLQKKFGDRIYILPVASKETQTPASAVKSFLLVRHLNLPSVIDDQTLNELFPHRFIPHEVWIDENGIVVAITSAEEITEDNINKFINKQNVKIEQKADDLKYNDDKALFVNGNGGDYSENYLVLSVLKEHDKALGGGVSLQLDSNGVKGISSNQTDIYNIYNATIGLGLNLVNPKRVFIESKDGLHNLPDSFAKIKNYSPWPGVEFLKSYSYSLQLSHSVSDTDFYRNYMFNDLNKFFGFRARIEKKLQPCYVLIKTTEHPLDLLKSKGGEPRQYSSTVGPNDEQKHGGYYVEKIQNLSFDKHFIKNILESWWHNPPIINETGLSSEKVDMDLNYLDQSPDVVNKPMDVNSIRKLLNKYGLDLIEANREADVLIISKK